MKLTIFKIFYHKNKSTKKSEGWAKKVTQLQQLLDLWPISYLETILSFKCKLAIESPLTPTGHISNRNWDQRFGGAETEFIQSEAICTRLDCSQFFPPSLSHVNLRHARVGGCIPPFSWCCTMGLILVNGMSVNMTCTKDLNVLTSLGSVFSTPATAIKRAYASYFLSLQSGPWAVLQEPSQADL